MRRRRPSEGNGTRERKHDGSRYAVYTVRPKASVSGASGRLLVRLALVSWETG